MLKVLRYSNIRKVVCSFNFIRGCCDGLSVCSNDTYGPLSYCAVAYKAGSRYEPYDSRGLTHYIRKAVELSSKCDQNVLLMRSLQSSGAGFECISNRQYIMFMMYSTIEQFEKRARYFFDMASTMRPNRWEWSLLDNKVKDDASSLTPKQRLMEMLHAVAFKKGLSSSIYCPSYNIGKISADEACEYKTKFFTKERCVVVSSGLPLSRTTGVASLMHLKDGKKSLDKEVADVFKGGEWRKYEKLNNTHVAIAVEGCKSTDKVKLFCYAALSYAIARKAHIAGTQGTKLCSGRGPLYTALSNLGQRVYVESFNIAYEDNGLFGLYGVSNPDDCRCFVDKMVDFLRNGISMEITDQDMEIGKAVLAMRVAEADTSPRDWIENVVSQKLIGMELQKPMELLVEIQKISISDIKNAAEEIKSKAFKLAMVSIGDLFDVPFMGDYQVDPSSSTKNQKLKDSSSKPEKGGPDGKLCNLLTADPKTLEKEDSISIAKNADKKEDKPTQGVASPINTADKNKDCNPPDMSPKPENAAVKKGPDVFAPSQGLGQEPPKLEGGKQPCPQPAASDACTDDKKGKNSCNPSDMSSKPSEKKQ